MRKNHPTNMAGGESLKLWYLNRINLLKGLPEEDLRFIASCSRMEKYKKGNIVSFQGDPAHSVYFLKEGRVKISRLSPEGREITLAILEKGEIFGELALAGVEKSDAQTQVLEDAIICAVRKEDFMTVLEKNIRLSLRVTKFIGFRKHQVERKLEDLVFKDVPTRLANLLLSLSAEYGERTAAGTKLNIVLSHNELASLIGTTRETVSVFLSQWKKDRMVDSEGRHLLLLDEKGLAALAQVAVV